MRRWLPVLALIAVLAAVVVGLGQAGGGDAEPPAERFELQGALRTLEGAPPAIASVHSDSSRILDGGFRKRMRSLRGHPVVVNKWASWCGPCRTEFPIFQRLATKYGKRVAFVGVNGKDNRDSALGFLADNPLPYPSYADPIEKLARAEKIATSYPVTAFYNERGEQVFIHQGGYRDDAQLERELRRYLGL